MKFTLSSSNLAIPASLRFVFTRYIFLHPFNSSVFLHLNGCLLKVYSYVWLLSALMFAAFELESLYIYICNIC